MPHDRLSLLLEGHIASLTASGKAKGGETIIRSVLPPKGGFGPRILLVGQDEKPFLRMNSNNYLGLSFDKDVIKAEETAARELGTGPGAVRFISGTWEAHVELEHRLARFHNREAAMIFSSAYAAVMGIIPPLTGEDTTILSDERGLGDVYKRQHLDRRYF